MIIMATIEYIVIIGCIAFLYYLALGIRKKNIKKRNIALYIAICLELLSIYGAYYADHMPKSDIIPGFSHFGDWYLMIGFALFFSIFIAIYLIAIIIRKIVKKGRKEHKQSK